MLIPGKSIGAALSADVPASAAAAQLDGNRAAFLVGRVVALIGVAVAPTIKRLRP